MDLGLTYEHNGYSIDLLKPIELYVNGKWISVKPVMIYKDNLFVENIDNKLPNLTVDLADLKWHFTVAEGKQIRNCSGKLKFMNKVSFILRSKSLF